MCGIIGFIGYINGYTYVINGLKMLQNRGYDGAGICGIHNGINNYIIKKYISERKNLAIDKLFNLEDYFNGCHAIIGHSRWATTGSATDVDNVHPHIDYKNKLCIVHNGIISNYKEIKEYLINQNVEFRSETDTEVIINLISFNYLNNTLEEAIHKSIKKLEGTWGIIIMNLDEPNKLYCMRKGSPLLIGFSDNYFMISSEKSGFCKYVNNYICIEDNDLFIISVNENRIEYNKQHYILRELNVDNVEEKPDPYEYWTIKEIYEQYNSSLRAINMGGRIDDEYNVKLGGLRDYTEQLKDVQHLIMLGCGSSYFSQLYCINVFKQISGFDTVQIFDGADFQDYDIPKSGKCCFILVSQSGETYDLYRCVKIAKEHDILTIGVINVVDSLIARDVDCGVYLNAGREVAVASTKAFTSQSLVLHMIAVWFAQIRDINSIHRKRIIQSLRNIPSDIQITISNTHNKCKEIAKHLFNNMTKNNHHSIFVLGKCNNEAIAREGSLKIKEITYVHSEAYASTSLKHGPFSMLCDNFPVIIINPNDNFFIKNNTTALEIKTRNGVVIGISDVELDDMYDFKIKTENNKIFSGLLANICCQLISFELAKLLGRPIDYPRNLCKSVTVN